MGLPGDPDLWGGGMDDSYGGGRWVPAVYRWFFRNPSRTIPQQPNVVVSSGDGKVIAIEEEFEPRYLKEKASG